MPPKKIYYFPESLLLTPDQEETCAIKVLPPSQKATPPPPRPGPKAPTAPTTAQAEPRPAPPPARCASRRCHPSRRVRRVRRACRAHRVRRARRVRQQVRQDGVSVSSKHRVPYLPFFEGAISFSFLLLLLLLSANARLCISESFLSKGLSVGLLEDIPGGRSRGTPLPAPVPPSPSAVAAREIARLREENRALRQLVECPGHWISLWWFGVFPQENQTTLQHTKPLIQNHQASGLEGKWT